MKTIHEMCPQMALFPRFDSWEWFPSVDQWIKVLVHRTSSGASLADQEEWVTQMLVQMPAAVLAYYELEIRKALDAVVIYESPFHRDYAASRSMVNVLEWLLMYVHDYRDINSFWDYAGWGLRPSDRKREHAHYVAQLPSIMAFARMRDLVTAGL
jgi:hypothetical protein